MKYASAIQTGTRHLAAGVPCQDSVHVIQNRDGIFAALADGAGSVRDSELAAEAVTRALTSFLANAPDLLFRLPEEELQEKVIGICTEAVAKAAPWISADCTLLAAALRNNGDVLLMHLGDGVILSLSDTLGNAVFSPPENGETVNHTYFVSGPEPEKHLRVYRGKFAECSGFLLTSDGVADMLYSGRTGRVADAVATMADWLSLLPGEVVSEKIDLELDELFREGTRDDMSLVLLLRGESV